MKCTQFRIVLDCAIKYDICVQAYVCVCNPIKVKQIGEICLMKRT